MRINIPGQGELHLRQAVFDFNGTVAVDGQLAAGVAERLTQLADLLDLYVLTADSNGSAARECAGLPVKLHIIGAERQPEAKASFVQGLSPGTVVFGNGVNDELMFRAAKLAVAVIGPEGCATAALMASHITVNSVTDGLDLLLKPHRLVPTLRR